MKEKVLVFGSGGMLASALVPLLKKKHEMHGVDRAEADIRDPEQVEKVVCDFRPDWIVNLAAYTDVDGCEKNREEAFRVNAEGARAVAAAAKGAGSRLVHISTDFVFDGGKKKPYVETDSVNPQSVYARSKRDGESAVLEILPPERRLVVRTSWLYGPNGKNFVDTILRLAREKSEIGVVNDQTGRPTFTKDLAEAILVLMEKKAHGIVHFANAGSCTWFDFARQILREAGVANVKVTPITSEQLNRPAKRPSYSVFSTEKYEKLTGKKIRPWQETLKEYLSAGALH